MNWISVKDEVPPLDKPVLFFLEDGTQCVGSPNRDGLRSFRQWIVGGWEHCYFVVAQMML
jgi:hypothetical protein